MRLNISKDRPMVKLADRETTFDEYINSIVDSIMEHGKKRKAKINKILNNLEKEKQ